LSGDIISVLQTSYIDIKYLSASTGKASFVLALDNTIIILIRRKAENNWQDTNVSFFALLF